MPSEKDPNHGHLVGGLLHSASGPEKRAGGDTGTGLQADSSEGASGPGDGGMLNEASRSSKDDRDSRLDTRTGLDSSGAAAV